MNKKNYTIKDIARMAGVSAGTVDRVLHRRGDVSPLSKEKVQKVLDEIDYHPNMFAIGLAAKRHYRFLCVIPSYKEDDYWHAVACGVEKASKELSLFNVHVDFLYYTHADEASYAAACKQVCEETVVDAVLMAPNFREETLALTACLEGRKVPYIFIDFNIKDTHALCYIGQDSEASGYFAAKLLMQNYREGQELAVFLNNQKDSPAEIQMQRRLEGFIRFIAEMNTCCVQIYDVVLSKEDPMANERTLDAFFREHPRATLGVVFNSRIYQVADYLREKGRRMDGLLGYDLLQRNVKYLQSGEVKYLIGQRPRLQGYFGLKALCDYVVFKRPVASVRHMPIDLLMKENIDFYFEFE